MGIYNPAALARRDGVYCESHWIWQIKKDEGNPRPFYHASPDFSGITDYPVVLELNEASSFQLWLSPSSSSLLKILDRSDRS